MKKTKQRSKEAAAESPDREDWDFSGVPNNELVACCYWEYARESAFIRGVKRRCIDPLWQEMSKSQLWEHCGFDLERIQSIGYAAEVFLRGFFFDPAEVRRPRHPDSPTITGSFPAAWQMLSAAERKERSHIRTDREALPLVPFQRGYAFFAADIARWCESQRRDAQIAGRELHPSLFAAGSEIGVFQIEWSDFTNDELAEGFRQWAKANRPKRFPKPSGQGHKARDWRAHLTRLAVMRLLSQFKTSEIITPRGRTSSRVFDSPEFAAAKWHDATKWHDARREAGRFFRQLFPFLPAGEKPCSWEYRLPGK